MPREFVVMVVALSFIGLLTGAMFEYQDFKSAAFERNHALVVATIKSCRDTVTIDSDRTGEGRSFVSCDGFDPEKFKQNIEEEK